MIQHRLAGRVCWILAQSGRSICKILTFPSTTAYPDRSFGEGKKNRTYWPWDTTAGYWYCSASTSKTVVTVKQQQLSEGKTKTKNN